MSKAKYILFGLLLTVIWVPMVQMIFQVVESAPLKGAFVPHAKIKLTDSTWFNGDFQRTYEQYLNDTIGFHQDFIRLRNQVDFSLFRKCHSYDIEVGRSGILVATWHLDAHLGKTRAVPSRIDTLVKMLHDLNDTLNKMNKTLLIVLAPSRGCFYKEEAPLWYDLTPTAESDYQHYVRLLSGSNIKFIDFNKSFLQQKSTSKYPLFTKCGIHWSSYGAATAADSTLKFIENAKGVDLPDMVFSKIELSTKARGADADLNATLNLIWPVKNDTMAYPKITYKNKEKRKLKLLTIGDSFYYGVMESNVQTEAFEEYSFWYYNSTIWSNGPNAWKNTKDVSIVDEINKYDVVQLISTETNLKEFGWGFIEKAWTAFCTPTGDRIAFYVEQIKKDPKWYEEVKKKAIQYNKDIDVQLRQDANYMVELEKQKK